MLCSVLRVLVNKNVNETETLDGTILNSPSNLNLCPLLVPQVQNFDNFRLGYAQLVVQSLQILHKQAYTMHAFVPDLSAIPEI